MQTTIIETRKFIYTGTLSILMAIVLLSSCKKNDLPSHGAAVSSYSSDVLDKWITLQLRLMRNTTGVPNQAFSRHFAYAGIAALESVAPGLSAQSASLRKWNGLTGLPTVDFSTKYYYPANVNAAMASISKSFYPNANAVDKAAIDSLEAALNESFISKETAERLNKSAAFGKAVAAAVFTWSESDNSKNASAPYTIPVGDGLWKPTPPANAAPSTPYWGNNRTTVANSLSNTQAAAPIAYSTNPSSPFYAMVKQVYDASQTLTEDQKAMAIFWRDVPGVTSPGHWLSILQQVMNKTNTKLDKSLLAYALAGAAVNDALIATWKAKYQFNLVRPITYIREVMGHTDWVAFIGTPPHPEYYSAHSALSAAAASCLQEVFGNIGTITDRTYEYMGLPARTYSSFNAIAEEAGMSRLYGGIHYLNSIQIGLAQGNKVAANILMKQGVGK